MSQPKVCDKRSQRASSEEDTATSSEDDLPSTEVQEVRKSSRGRILKKSRKGFAMGRLRREREREEEKRNSSDDSSDSFKMGIDAEKVKDKNSPKDQLVLDDLIDDFGEELEDCGLTQSNEDTDDEDSSQLVLDLLKTDSEDEVANEIEEDNQSFVPPLSTMKAHPTYKYGKLWEFIRDLLKIEKYNPSVIRWENAENGEFRIVDTSMVSKLWGSFKTTKQNKKMNFEKLSRAMRYYYKCKIFETNPNKRLVYKFGPRATGWKPKSTNAFVKSRQTDAVFAGENRRCSRCLQVLASQQAAEVHPCAEIFPTATATRADAHKHKAHNLSPSILNNDHQYTNKQLSKQLSNIKPLLDVSAEDEVVIPIPMPALTDEDPDESDEYKIESPDLIEFSEEPFISSIETKTSSEQLALESLISLGEERKIEPVEPPAAQPPSIPLTGTDIFNQSDKNLERTPNCTNQEEESTISLLAEAELAEETESESFAKSYIVFPSFDAAERQETISPPKVMGKINDKIAFSKSAGEKSKKQTILQKREDGRNINQNMDADLGDDIEIVKIIKTSAEEQSSPFQNAMNSGYEKVTETDESNDSVSFKGFSKDSENVVNNASNSGDQSLDGKRKIAVNEKYLNISHMKQIIQTVPNDARKLIKINEKYARFITIKPPSNLPTKEDNVTGTHDMQGQEAVPNMQERTIRINSKYSNFMAGRTPEECGNIATKNEGTSTSSETRTVNESAPKIKINEKYSNFIFQTDTENLDQMDIQTKDIHQANKVSQNIVFITERIRDTQQSVSNGPPNKTSTLASTLTSKLRNTKISDIRAQRLEQSQNVPLESTWVNHPSLKRKDSINDDHGKRPKQDENIQNPSVERQSDSCEEAGMMQKNAGYEPQDDTEPLPGLWKFLCSLLHNPRYNPTLVTWEILEDGMFRINSLQDLYSVWTTLKGSPMNYELLSKKLKIYDERKLLHGVSRCVYQFGVNAEHWKPHEGEISMVGQRPVPYQAAWPQSRYYEESMSSLGQSKPIFTLTPLDTETSQISELKILSDYSRIIKTNNFLPNQDPEKESPPAGLQLVTTEKVIKLECNEFEEVKPNINEIQISDQKLNKSNRLEIPCNLTLPSSENEKAILKLDDGFCIELDQSLFKGYEAFKREMPVLENKPKIRTNIVHKDKSDPFKRKKKMKKKLVKKIKPPVDGPLTASQLMDVVMSKKLNFFKSQVSDLTEKGPKKFDFILPKPGQDPLVSSPPNTKDKANTPCTEPVANITQNRQYILQPMSTLGYQLIPSENIEIQIPESTSEMKNGSSLPPSETSTTPLTSLAYDESSNQSGVGSSDGEENPNVLRCRMYRVKKRIMMKEGEKELDYLTRVNNDLRDREEYLDYTVRTLKQFYITMIKENRYKCCQK